MILRLIALFCFFILTSCSSFTKHQQAEVQGEAFGSYYKIKYSGPLAQSQLESDLKIFFKEFNQEFSTYQNDSAVSLFNHLPAHQKLNVSKRFIQMLKLAQTFYEETQHIFDPTLAPLIKLWGFGGGTSKTKPSAKSIQEARELVGFHLIKWDEANQQVWKTKNGVSIDLNAFAPGWAADLLGDYFKTKGVNHFLIDISGELLARGMKNETTPWMVGVERPSPTFTGETQLALPLFDQGISTSGNYRQFYVDKGVKRSHIIDPRIGAPVKNEICSATVISSTAASADAWSTALMILGESGLSLVEAQGKLALLIRYEKNEVFRSIPGKEMDSYILKHSSR
jgi:thiamine biosynthesis lipoprotein